MKSINFFCFAGTHSTSFTLSLATYHLLRNPLKLEKLLEELQTVKENPKGLLEYRDVHELPYLVIEVHLRSRTHIVFARQ